MINPSENANNQRFVARLRQEVEAWRQDGTITPEQGQSILARYPEYAPGYEASRRRQSLVVGLSILGAILIGLSVITFFAANWNEISRGVKLGSLFVGMALSYGSGYYLWNRAGYGAYAVALVLLGCIIYGAGVHLIGQIYHIEVNDPNLSMFWFLGVAPLAYVTRSRPVMFLAIVVFLAAVGFRLVPWLEEVSGSSTAILTTEEVSHSSTGILSAALYLSLAAFLYAIGKAKKLFEGWESIGGLFQAFGLLVGFGALYLLTFNDLFFRDGNALGVAFGYWALAYGASVIALALMAGLAWLRVRRGDRSTMELVEGRAVRGAAGGSPRGGASPRRLGATLSHRVQRALRAVRAGADGLGIPAGARGPHQPVAGADRPVRHHPLLRVFQKPVRQLADVLWRRRDPAGRRLPAGSGPPQDARFHAR